MSIEAELDEILSEGEGLDIGEAEYAFEQPEGPYDSTLYGEMEEGYPEESEWDNGGDVLSEGEAIDLAQELMNVTSEAELEEFLGGLFKKIKRGIRAVGRAALPIAGNFLKRHGASLLKRALPLVGSAVGSIVPGAGTLAGGALGGALSQLMPGETSYESDYEAKLDLSKRLVQTVANAAAQTAKDPSAAYDASAAAKRALAAQVQATLPPAVRQALRTGGRHHRRPSSGRWIRQGNQIIILGA